MKLTQEIKTDILLALFTASIITANLTGNKITTILGFSVSVGIFSYPISFLITDIISEVYGKKKAFSFFISGLLSIMLSLGLLLLALNLKPNPRFIYEAEYQTIFKMSVRMFLASLAAFVLSQTNDIFIFHFLKKKTHNKFLWLRNNLSTIISQFIDTSVFMFIAFYGLTPKFTFTFIFSLIIPYWIFKIIFALLDTPICYLGVKWLKSNK